MAAPTLLEVDQGQFENTSSCSFVAHRRSPEAYPGSPDQIISRVQDFIQAVTLLVEQIRAAEGNYKSRA
jgi:hypothetical protein